MDQRQLLEAIRDGLVTQHGVTVQGRWYLVDGVTVSYMELRRLVRADLIDVPLAGPPTLAPKGERVLRANRR